MQLSFIVPFLELVTVENPFKRSVHKDLGQGICCPPAFFESEHAPTPLLYDAEYDVLVVTVNAGGDAREQKLHAG
jgi:hypothetical protein